MTRFVKEIPDLLKVHPLPPHVVVDRCVAMEVSESVHVRDECARCKREHP